MKIIRNDKLITRNAKISQYILYAALICLVVGIYITFTNNTAEDIGTAYLFLIPSYILVQISITMGNRWSRSPRPDEVVTQSLKGLDNQFTLYIYTTAIPHLLVGPAGVWIIKTYHQSGKIYLDEKKNVLKQKGGGSFITKIFANEGIGNIDRESEVIKAKLNTYFEKQGVTPLPEVNIVNVFISEDVVLDASKYHEVLLTSEKLKDFIRKTAKNTNFPVEEVEKITAQLPEQQ
ncbi:MAG TPA: hypothetical protein DCK95_04790 [Anaerolineaceae bacterium]|uniref:NERD domain-containing protein n=1 Tax=Anaerolinea thermophila TaxID=167964 RepID=A0A101FYL2_9CHLR|nr:MAG: hypothetical protein XD73_0218 [Anaerolinea thermophila]HAF61624.1 hypothetical protein [Anaerolineaceae bacterium]